MCPGDLIMGDANGVWLFRPHSADVLTLVQEFAATRGTGKGRNQSGRQPGRGTRACQLRPHDTAIQVRGIRHVTASLPRVLLIGPMYHPEERYSWSSTSTSRPSCARPRRTFSAPYRRPPLRLCAILLASPRRGAARCLTTEVVSTSGAA